MSWSPNYATPTDLAAFLRIGDVDDNAQIGLALAAASRAIDAECRRQFGGLDSAAPRIYTARFDGEWVIDIDDLFSTSGLAVAVDTDGDGGFATTLSDYTLDPANAEADGVPWTRLVSRVGLPAARDAVRVTARWGWTSIPDAVKQACLLQASRFLARRDSPYGIAGSPEAGSEMRLLATLDPDVKVALRAYRRRWWAV